MQHLEELRWRLVRSIIAVFIGAAIALLFSNQVLELLLLPFRKAVEMHAQGLAPGAPAPATRLIFLAPTEGFMVHIKLAIFAGLLISLPYVLYQLWQFVAPGLLEHEKRHLPKIVTFSSLFFFAGAAFCYLVVIRYGLNFLLGFQKPELVANISIKEYLRFVTMLILVFGIVFEMPVLSYFLSKVGLLTPEFMRQKRRYSIVTIFVMAAIITPPDAFTQVMLAMPLIILYEISIWVSHAVVGKGDKTDAPPAPAPPEEAAVPAEREESATEESD